MMKNVTKPYWIAFGGILFFLFTRLYNLTILPIFTDESIYIYWAKYIQTYHSHWFLSLTDGKPPLLIWMMASFLQILPAQFYLIAGRLPSVLAGVVSFIAMYHIGKLLFQSQKAGILAALLYTVFPFTLFYDRLALFDSLLSAMLLCTVYFALRFSKTRRFLDAGLWGIFLGLAFLSKPTAIIYLILTPVCVVLFVEWKEIKKSWQRYVLGTISAIFIAEVLTNLQRVSHVYSLADVKNQEFQQPMHELLTHPFELTFGNLNGFFNWILSYYTIPIVILGLGSLVWLFLQHRRQALILSMLWFIPLLVLATVGRIIFPRYMLFTVPYFLLMISGLFTHLFQKKRIRVIVSAVFFVFLLPLLLFDYFLLINPAVAPLPKTDRDQYITTHASGYGIENVIAFINQEKQKGNVSVVTQGTFGLYPYAFTLEYWNDPRVEIIPRWPLSSLDDQILSANKTHKVFLIFKEAAGVPKDMPLKTILKSEKPGGEYPIYVTEIK